MRRDVAKEFFVKTQKEVLGDVLAGKIEIETPVTKIEAFLFEFPWIRNYVARSAICYVFVQVFEFDLLGYRSFGTRNDLASFVRMRGCTLSTRLKIASADKTEYESLVFFDEKGSIASSPKSLDETVGEVIHRLGSGADRIRFLLSFHRYTGAVIVYRVPKNEPSLLKWIAKQAAEHVEPIRS